MREGRNKRKESEREKQAEVGVGEPASPTPGAPRSLPTGAHPLALELTLEDNRFLTQDHIDLFYLFLHLCCFDVLAALGFPSFHRHSVYQGK